MTQRRWLATKCFQCGKEVEEKDAIIIDEEKDHIFCSEDCLYQHFSKEITAMEKEFQDNRQPSDIQQTEFGKFEGCLEELLEAPDEIWEDSDTLPDTVVYNYIGQFVIDEQSVYYVAVVHLTGDMPTFVFLHFPTNDSKLVERFRRGRLIFDKSQAEIEIEGAEEDALSDGDELAQGLFKAMLALRSPADFPEEEFGEFLRYRQETIEDADEMWRSTDLQGNTLVTFIKEFAVDEGDFTYVVITIQDVVSGSHFVLFSFPTKDANLVDRYRQGQSLDTQAPKQASH
ncbi:MAG TPA: PBECR2 nuclease fold domain-containing protein [Bdellovibrionales bacterium]|nr:PBECR2 nuclease fold domain-containing protein [Bdellovibrionales bacterium]